MGDVVFQRLCREIQVNHRRRPRLQIRGCIIALEFTLVKDMQAGGGHAFAMSATHAVDLAVHPFPGWAAQNASGCGRARLAGVGPEQVKHISLHPSRRWRRGRIITVVLEFEAINLDIKGCAVGVFVNGDKRPRRFYRSVHGVFCRLAERIVANRVVSQSQHLCSQ